MTEDKVTAEVDPNGIDQSYKFLNALLDDYNACKTELARSGISKAFKMLLDQIGKDHAGLACKFNELKKELEATKAKLPKTKEEITKILHEAGFHELEECGDGVWTGSVPSPDLTPTEYGVLYRRLYGEMTKAALFLTIYLKYLRKLYPVRHQQCVAVFTKSVPSLVNVLKLPWAETRKIQM